MMHWGWGYGMGFGMILWWAVVIGLIVLVIYGLTNIFRNQPSKKEFNNNDSSLEILKERFAKGEINEEEYENKKKILLK